MEVAKYSPNIIKQANSNHVTTQHGISDYQISETNPMTKAAAELISILVRIRREHHFEDVTKLWSLVISNLKEFQSSLASLNYEPRIILAARYCLCTAIDEAVLNTDWGVNSVWSQQTLLSQIHQETWGGERFYVILQAFSEDAYSNIDILELLYLLLNLGFEGKFYNQQQDVRHEILNRLFYKIKSVRNRSSVNFRNQVDDDSDTYKILNLKSNIRKGLIWAASIITIIILLVNILFYFQSKSEVKELDAIGHDSAITIYSQLLNRPLTAHQIENGQSL